MHVHTVFPVLHHCHIKYVKTKLVRVNFVSVCTQVWRSWRTGTHILYVRASRLVHLKLIGVCGSRWLADPLVIHGQKASCVLHISRNYGHFLPNRASCLVSKVSKLTVTSFAQPVFVLGALQTHISNFLFRWLSYSADHNTILGENKELSDLDLLHW